MLGQRRDRYQRLQVLRKLPVVGQLVVVHPRPFANETQRSRRQRPVEHAESLDLHLGHIRRGSAAADGPAGTSR